MLFIIIHIFIPILIYIGILIALIYAYGPLKHKLAGHSLQTYKRNMTLAESESTLVTVESQHELALTSSSPESDTNKTETTEYSGK